MPNKDKEVRRQKNSEYVRNRMINDPEFKQKLLARSKANTLRYRAEVAKLIYEFKSRGCIICSEKEVCCLDCHHLDESAKEFTIGLSSNLGISPKRMKLELEKCVCLCANCHRKLHAGLITLDKPV